MNNSDTLIFYHYFEKDAEYIDNFYHFLRFGYLPTKDYVIIISGDCSVELPQLRNVKYIFTENQNNDYGGYCNAIKAMPDVLDYDYFFFINSSVRGPFTLANDDREWTENFKQYLDNDVALVGISINILHTDTIFSEIYERSYGGLKPYSHVQTTAYALHRRGLETLIDERFYEVNQAMVKEDVITHYELRLSQLLIEKGWNIKCLLPEYNQIDYRLPHQDINPTSGAGDPTYPFAYFGRTFHPYEQIFIKTNREMLKIQYLNRLAYSMHMSKKFYATLSENSGVGTYIRKLQNARVSNEVINFSEVSLNPLEIMNYVRGLMLFHPELRPYLIEAAGESKES